MNFMKIRQLQLSLCRVVGLFIWRWFVDYHQFADM